MRSMGRDALVLRLIYTSAPGPECRTSETIAIEQQQRTAPPTKSGKYRTNDFAKPYCPNDRTTVVSGRHNNHCVLNPQASLGFYLPYPDELRHRSSFAHLLSSRMDSVIPCLPTYSEKREGDEGSLSPPVVRI